MTKRINNIVIVVWIISLLLFIFTVFKIVTTGEKSYITFGIILIPTVFVSFIYGVFAKMAKPILLSMPEKTSVSTQQKERTISLYKFLRIWVD